MKNSKPRLHTARRMSPVLAALACLLLATGAIAVESAPLTQSFIIQAASVEQAAALVRGVDGTVTHELGVIRSVAAELTAEQRLELTRAAGVRRVWDNGTAELTGKPVKEDKDAATGSGHVVETFYPTQALDPNVSADNIHALVESAKKYGVY